MNPRRVVLIGGSGFVGSAVANHLSATGTLVLIPTRRRSRAGHVLLLPTIQVVEADVHDPATLSRLLAGADAVVNLVGILHSRGGDPYGPDFANAHVELPKKIVTACRAAGVRRLVHVSALGASADAPSEYLRSKAAGEAAIRSTGADLDWVIVRPSVMFGRNDRFLNMFAQLAGLFPVLPLAGADARFQPVHVEDVAAVIARCLSAPEAAGQIYEAAGPTVYTLRELVEYVCTVTGRRRAILALPDSVAALQARLMELAPQPLMSRDNLRSMQVDNVASGEALPFGLTPTALEEVVPTWLGKEGRRAYYYPFRRHARR